MTSPLFPGNDSQPLQHHQTVEIFRSVIEATGTTMTRNGPNGSIGPCTATPNMTPKDLDPTLNWCLEHRHLFHPLTRFQHDVIEEIRDLVLEFEEHTMAWFHTLPPHVQHAYKHKDSVTQIPILIHLPTKIGVPTDRGLISRVVGLASTYGQAYSRSQLACSPRSEVPPAYPDGRLQTEEPRVHPQQARDQPC